MELFNTGHDPTPGARLVGRNARWPMATFTLLYAAIVAVLWFVPGAGFFFWINLPIAALFVVAAIKSWRSLGRADNWMLAVDSRGVWLNLRDASHRDAPPGETVVFLRHGEVSGVREHVHRYETPSSDGGTTSHRDRCLDLFVPDEVTSRIAEALAADRGKPTPPRRYLGGLMTARSIGPPPQPVTVPEPGLLRVAVSRPHFRMTPGANRVLRTLEEYAPRLETDQRRGPALDSLDDVEVDRQAAELARLGQRMAAAKLLVQRRGLSLSDAREAVTRIAREEPDRVDSD